VAAALKAVEDPSLRTANDLDAPAGGEEPEPDDEPTEALEALGEAPSEEAAAAARTKKRGRPLGAKNKPKLAIGDAGASASAPRGVAPRGRPVRAAPKGAAAAAAAAATTAVDAAAAESGGDRGEPAAGPSRKRGRGALENFSDRDTDSYLVTDNIQRLGELKAALLLCFFASAPRRGAPRATGGCLCIKGNWVDYLV